MDPIPRLWITYFGLCVLFVGKAAIPAVWQPWVLALLGLPLSWWSMHRPAARGAASDIRESFSGVRIVRENGKPCLLREKGITYKGCYYSDVGGCAIPQDGLKGDCPAHYEDFRRRYGGPNAPPTSAPAPASTADADTDAGTVSDCSGDAWVRIVSLRDDEIDTMLAEGKNPLAACIRRKPEIVQRMRERFLDDIKNADNTQAICAKVRKDELRATNRISRQLFRDVYQECFSDAEPAGALSSTMAGDAAPRVKTSGFVLMDEPELLTIDKNGRESDDVLRRHMRQEFVSKCQRFVSQKTPEQVQAFIELGEKVENLEWWRNVSLMVERTAEEIRKAQILNTSRTTTTSGFGVVV